MLRELSHRAVLGCSGLIKGAMESVQPSQEPAGFLTLLGQQRAPLTHGHADFDELCTLRKATGVHVHTVHSLSWFPIAVITIDHKPHGLKQHKFITLRFWRSECQKQSSG
jgi:hypothetical protein